MSWVRRIRPVRVGGALVILIALVWAIIHFTRPNPYSPPKVDVIASPEEYTTSFWDETLGGDEALGEETWRTLNDTTNSDLSEEDSSITANLGRNVLKADLTGVGRESWDSYWSDVNSEPFCSSVNVKASSSMKLPVSTDALYAKILLVWDGECSQSTGFEDGEITINYIYAHKEENGWVPVREWQIPSETSIAEASAVTPQDYELKDLTCTDPPERSLKARILVANAWSLMCEDAAKDGVTLKTTSGYRTFAEQADLYAQALKYYKTESEAKRWVSYADEYSCLSKHCDGTALSVKDSDSLVWMNTIVGCSVDGQVTMGASSCENGASSVKRMNLYGFGATVPYVPSYIEFILPVEMEKTPANCTPGGTSVPTMVASIFRCRLQEAGLGEEEVDKVVAEALVVSRCESAWNPLAIAFGGRFQSEPHPVSGETYDQTGVFMLSGEQGDQLLDGRQNLTDPVSNINGAASLWLGTRDWSAFGCATGHGELFESGPTLPQYGGPDLPDWAKTY